jgi:alanine dehydrogenase
MELLWLTEEEVRSLLTMDEAIAAVQKAFHDHGMGRVEMPPKSYLNFSRYSGDLRTMPAYLMEQDQAGVKIVNVHAANPERGLPTVMALIILNSPQTGAPLAVMGGTFITAMRTGAAGAVAARALARKDSRVAGMIGAGVQAKAQLLGLSRCFEIERVLIFDAQESRSRSLEQEGRQFLDCDYEIVSNSQQACRCDILVTTTPSRRPVVEDAWIMPGTHINAIGADAAGKQELSSTLTARARVVVDDMAQAVHSGEVNVPISQGLLSPEMIHAQIGEILAGKKPGRMSDDDITVFDSTGLAIQDVAVGHAVYKKALSIGKGLRLKA